MHHGQQWPPAPDARPTKIAQMLHQDSPGANVLHQSSNDIEDRFIADLSAHTLIMQGAPNTSTTQL